MANSFDIGEYVTLRGGVALPTAAVRLALDLESRGLRIAVEGDALVVAPRDRITADDREQIRRWRDQLKVIAGYVTTAVL